MESPETNVHAVLSRTVIDRCISHLRSAIVQAKNVGPNLWHIHDALPLQDIGYIKRLINEGNWWKKAELQYNLDRLELPFKMNTIIENLWEIFDSSKDHLGQSYSKVSVTVWKDGPNFSMPVHIDNDRVQAAIQIYLGEGDSPGTTFYPEGREYEIAYCENTGYIMINSDNMTHGVIANTPHQGRLSIYAVYG